MKEKKPCPKVGEQFQLELHGYATLPMKLLKSGYNPGDPTDGITRVKP